MSNLPSLGFNVSSQSSDKQLIAIRNYVNQLKEELDTELMNIGYDNLSGDLKKRLDKNTDDIMVSSNDLEELQGYISANVLTADYINANFVTTNALVTQYLSTEYLSASEAFIGAVQTVSLSASQITSGVISAGIVWSEALAAKIIASQTINTKYLNATNISGLFNSPSNGLTITTETLRANKFYYYTSVGSANPAYHQLSLKTFTVDGTTYRCLGV